MLSSRSKGIKKTREKKKVFGNPNLLLDHFEKNNYLPNVALPGLTFDHAANRYYADRSVKKEVKKIEEIQLHSEAKLNLLFPFRSGSILSLVNKSKIVYSNNQLATVNKQREK
eukprot:TRINITY_DN11947_c0_g1_i6.p1 TRINITY_DN11947_c0_g1~~TRINITY_DN11947_c0_g1_i6.p1  ORF type:complete len:113 (-),score=23.56 TRINITY_DN11947_c0_g1_i6:393-731(-)